ncbi:MAG: long-chain-fatty-acid--CoA ligase [Alphaproteobacteria bacterium]|nr:long-chain-fatty-acid--CoA ligase [Alphaproteobacteria bacterium]
MRGQMMDRPLLISSLIKYAADYQGDVEVVSRTVEGPIHRYTYSDCHRRACRVAGALRRLGVEPGDRIATLAWNGYRHLELYFGVSGMGAVLHTVNPRLFADQIEYIVNHAEDKYVFLDVTFVPLLEPFAEMFTSVRGYVVMTDRANMPETTLPNALVYEELLSAEKDDHDWPEFDENAAASLCYTSGTTSRPKGALYSHRSTVLHTYSICLVEALGLSSGHAVLPAVPMFHANAWGIPYGCALTGSKLVLPGQHYDGESMFDLLENEGVTITAGVPTIWQMLIEHMRATGKSFSRPPLVLIGGAAAPLSMIRAFEEEFGCDTRHAWGMTEMSPVGTSGHLKPRLLGLPKEEQYAYKAKQGHAIYGVDLKIVDDDGKELPHDGEAFGELLVRGSWIIDSYFKDEDATAAAFDDEGWFRTGDVTTIDPDGYIHIVDRSKDVIKSGGEWISSIDLENIATGHPDVAQAAVIGIAHPKWGERPLLIVVAAGDRQPTRDEILTFLDGKIAKWWMPDDVQFVDALPLTATGKISKLQLREMFKDYALPTA